jgi:hypothetical protein
MFDRIRSWLTGALGISINYAGWVLAAAMLIAGALMGWATNGWRLNAELASVQAAWDKERAARVAAAAAASEASRAEEWRRGEALAAAASDYLEGIEHAKNDEQRLVANLRANAVRLRRQWAGCETRRVSETAARPAEPDEAARLRIESAARIVRAAAECDAHVAGLQLALKSERQQESTK